MKQLIIIALLTATVAASAANPKAVELRVNRVGYLTDDFKTAVYMGDIPVDDLQFDIVGTDAPVSIDSVVPAAPWGNFPHAARIYFTSATTAGNYALSASLAGTGVVAVREFKIGDDVYSALNLRELPLNYLRQQRCGYNPAHSALCHQHDGYRVLSGNRDGEPVDVRGGWHDASDYLQYLPTSANTVAQLLYAYRLNPAVWADEYDADGNPGANGVPDILDEARWGLEWMVRMNPAPGEYMNQIADDRDHRYVGVPQADSTDYGFGPGLGRPVYPVCGEPYGLQRFKNRSTGEASSVAKFASAFALGSQIFGAVDSVFAADLSARARMAFDYAMAHPGAAQTAPCSSPYFYEEDNWTDDLEFAGATLGQKRIAAAYGRLEPTTPWMGADSARHYQWYPFINLGHAELAAASADSLEFRGLMRRGLELCREKGKQNPFYYGVPFIWCSNNLGTALATQALLYSKITGDRSFIETETAARDWLFGLNPWGQIMIILPSEANLPSPSDPHSAMTDLTVGGLPGREWLAGGLVDGPVYNSIYSALWGVHLRNDDAFAPFHGRAVYHDDFADYSTNEPTMDGTAALATLLSELCK